MTHYHYLPTIAAMNLTPSRHPQDPVIIETVLASIADVVSLYRFGSAGSEYERADSDLDVAILAGHLLSFDERLNLAAGLSRVVGRDVDVVDMRAIPVTLRVQIAADGSRLFASNPNESAEFESRAFSDYARLNEERHGILEDIRQRGRIYG